MDEMVKCVSVTMNASQILTGNLKGNKKRKETNKQKLFYFDK